MLIDSSYHLSTVQRLTVLESFVDPVPYLHAIKTRAEQFKIQPGTALNDEKNYELLISAATTLDKKFKRDARFSSKLWMNVYELVKLLNDDNEASFDIDSSVGMIQEYPSQQKSIYLTMRK